MTLKEAQNKAEAAKALLDEIYHAAFGGELKLDRNVREILDVAVDENFGTRAPSLDARGDATRVRKKLNHARCLGTGFRWLRDPTVI